MLVLGIVLVVLAGLAATEKRVRMHNAYLF